MNEAIYKGYMLNAFFFVWMFFVKISQELEIDKYPLSKFYDKIFDGNWAFSIKKWRRILLFGRFQWNGHTWDTLVEKWVDSGQKLPFDKIRLILGEWYSGKYENRHSVIIVLSAVCVICLFPLLYKYSHKVIKQQKCISYIRNTITRVCVSYIVSELIALS